jgi:hypothetical protein
VDATPVELTLPNRLSVVRGENGKALRMWLPRGVLVDAFHMVMLGNNMLTESASG